MKKNKLVILCILVSIGTLFLVHIAYSIQAPFKFLESKWEAGDLISYIGTVALGIVAISQSARDFELSEKLAEKQPFFIVTNYSASKVESIVDYFLEIENDDSTSNTHNGNKYVLYIDDADINNTEVLLLKLFLLKVLSQKNLNGQIQQLKIVLNIFLFYLERKRKLGL